MERIRKYFIDEKKETPVVANLLAKKLTKYEDVKEEFIKWLETREYSDKEIVPGYSALKIHNMQPSLDPSGVYGFFVTLRDNPDKAEEYIRNNFARK